MHLNEVQLKNFRNKAKLNVELGPRLTLLVGENGTGKTAVLDGIAIALGEISSHLPKISGITFNKQGDIHQQNNQLAAYARVSVSTPSRLEWDRTLRRDQSQKTLAEIPKGCGTHLLHRYLDENVIDPYNENKSFTLPVYAYYSVSRALLDPPLRRRNFQEAHNRFEALHGALGAHSSFRSAFIWFYNKENEEHRLQRDLKDFNASLPELDAVRRAITSCFPDLEDPQIALNPLRFMVRQRGEWLNIVELSDGYKTLLGLVLDLSVRMATANPHLKDPLHAKALVMIDEVDLHLHPTWQRVVIGDLLKTFPGTQFVMTTHSPYVVETVNNHLKRHQIPDMAIDDPEIQSLLPLSSTEIRAYRATLEGMEDLLDRDSELLQDSLLTEFNTVNELYDRMRDIEWDTSQK